MMSLVSRSVQVRNPSSSKDEAALQKDEELLMTVECNSQLPRPLFPFLVPLAWRKKLSYFNYIAVSHCILQHTQVSEWKALKEMMMLVMVAVRGKEVCPRSHLQ